VLGNYKSILFPQQQSVNCYSNTVDLDLLIIFLLYSILLTRNKHSAATEGNRPQCNFVNFSKSFIFAEFFKGGEGAYVISLLWLIKYKRL